MATETSNIDDLLMSGKTATQPETPEHQYEANLDMVDDGQPELDDYSQSKEVNSEKNPQVDQNEYENDEPEGDEGESSQETQAEMDEYGNEKPKPRTYTEEEVNEMFRRRFKNKPQAEQQAVMQQVQQAQQDFNYNPDSDQGYQEQLETFIERTINKISQKQLTQAQQQREQAAQAEFQEKFTQGMERFSDFREVVGNQPITDPMTHALRGIKDPTAFVYAASKRHPQELARISQIPDPYAQMVEMGKLEERMRKSAQGTKAPRPLQRTKEDAAPAPVNKKKSDGDSIEDLIAKADAKRRAQLTARRGRG